MRDHDHSGAPGSLVHGLLAQAAAATPTALALIERERTATYAELDRLANQCAQVLVAYGVARGDRVVIALENSAEMVAAYFGVMKAGAVAVPLPAGPRSDRLPAALADCTPRLVIVDEPTARGLGPTGLFATVPHTLVASLSPPAPFASFSAAMTVAPSAPVDAAVTDTDLAAIIYTSGSTGQPRGVMLTHRNLVANARSIVSYLQLTAADRVMCVLPFNYVYGLSLLHTHVAVGGSLVIENRAAFPNVVLEAMAGHAVTGFAGVPSTFALMLHRSNLAAARLPQLRYVTQAGGGMPPAKVAEWLARGPRADFYVMYGATEAGARLTYLPPADLARKSGSIGRAIPDVEVRVLTEDGRVAAPGEVGELVARGANIAQGYWNRPDESAQRFSSDGYRTGDLGYADDEGFLFLVGRQHDMIKVGANRVGAREIEDVLHEHPAVHEAAVVAAYHDLLGEVPIAFVALRAPLPDPEMTLRGFAAARLAAYKVPARVVVLAELPKLPGAGKLDRTALRQLATAGPAPAS
ncbi:MAG: class I adenylate-forming enzyme family protein [Acidobacteriota bacterium]